MKIYKVNFFANIKQRLVLLGSRSDPEGSTSELADLKLGAIFDSLKIRRIITELITRLYRLEQMEASLKQNSVPISPFVAKLAPSRSYATTSFILLKWWT